MGWGVGWGVGGVCYFNGCGGRVGLTYDREAMQYGCCYIVAISREFLICDELQ